MDVVFIESRFDIDKGYWLDYKMYYIKDNEKKYFRTYELMEMFYSDLEYYLIFLGFFTPAVNDLSSVKFRMEYKLKTPSDKISTYSTYKNLSILVPRHI